mgnify:CR=1 FL=1
MIIKDKTKLTIKCEPVDNIIEGEDLAVKLFEELGDKGIGLAANQIGINKRVCVVNVKEPIFFINPKITKLDGSVIYPESCLSFPKKVINTKRARWVTVESDNHGTIVLGSDTDDENLLEAVCVQHEIDHLDGITMYDRRFIRPPLKSNKIGRNEKVTIEKGSESKVLKYKKAQPMLEDGWTLVGQ